MARKAKFDETRKFHSTCIRFKNDEYESILKDAEARGVTIPALLKLSYFMKRLDPVLMPQQDAQAVLVALNRLGNNVNQIAKKLNSGYEGDCSAAIEDMIDHIQVIKRQVGVV